MSISVFRYALMGANRLKSSIAARFRKTSVINGLRDHCIGRGHIGSCLALKTAALLLDSFVSDN